MNTKKTWKKIISSPAIFLTLLGLIIISLSFLVLHYKFHLSVARSLFFPIICIGAVGFIFLLDNTLFGVIRNVIEQRENEKKLKLQQKETDRINAENKVKAEELFDKVQHSEIKAKWSDILFIMDTLSLRESYKAVLLCHVNFIDLFEMSHIKEHFKWESLNGPLGRINDALGRTFNDAVIQKLIAQVKVMEQYCHYKGYEALYKEISNYDTVCKLVKLKPPCKKELVS